jgi:hypothetical protein
MLLMPISGKSRLLSAGFCTETCHRYRIVKEGFQGEVNALDHRVKRFRKYVLSFEAPSVSQSCNL